MAHIAKYKAASVGHMLAHYRREYLKSYRYDLLSGEEE